MTVISSSLTAPDEILVRLTMDDNDIETAGMAGEFAASMVFDRAGVGWIDLGQSRDHHSTFLKVSRPIARTTWCYTAAAAS